MKKLTKSTSDVKTKRQVILNPIDIGRQALTWKQESREGTITTQFPKEDDFARVQSGDGSEAGNSTSTPCLVFFILSIMAIAQMIQYCTANLYVASLPGNRYVNGMIFGGGEMFSMLFSNFLMNNMLDMTAFRIVYMCGLVSFLMLIFLAESSLLVTYLSNLLLITSIGGWNNTYLLILEMRVPPQNIGSIAALTRTFAVGSSVITPTIANLPAPYPFLFLMGLSTFSMLLTFLLPAPGLNLPQA